MDQKVDADAAGLFLVKYNVTTGLMGAPDLTLALTVDTPTGSVNGLGHVTQALLHPDLVTARLSGNYHEVFVMDVPTNIVSLTGYSPVVVNGDTRPVLEVELSLQGWDSGTATFSYRTAPNGPFKHITDAKVTKIS